MIFHYYLLKSFKSFINLLFLFKVFRILSLILRTRTRPPRLIFRPLGILKSTCDNQKHIIISLLYCYIRKCKFTQFHHNFLFIIPNFILLFTLSFQFFLKTMSFDEYDQSSFKLFNILFELDVLPFQLLNRPLRF